MSRYFKLLFLFSKNLLINFIECDNTECATCQNSNKECIKQCDIGCIKCHTNGKCIDDGINQVCKYGYLHDSDTNTCIKCHEKCNHC